LTEPLAVNYFHNFPYLSKVWIITKLHSMRKTFTTLLLLLAAFFAFSQAPEIEWENTIGGFENDYLYSIQQTSDGGYILGGYSSFIISGDKTENSQGQNDYWVVKLNAAGKIQWQNSIGGNGDDYLRSIQQTSDGGYILGGYSGSNSSGDKTENTTQGTQTLSDYWVVKLDTAGKIQWQNTIGGGSTDELYSIQQTSDGGYILGGYSQSNISGDKTENVVGNGDYWVVKLDTAGNIQWQSTIGRNYFDYLYSIRQTSDGGYILGGYSDSFIPKDKTENMIGYYDYWVVKLDNAGKIQWENTIGGRSNDYLRSIRQTSDGGYILGGHSDSPMSGDKTENSQGIVDYWVVKLDTYGEIEWQNTIGGKGNDYLYSVEQTSDGGYILGGYSESNISGDKTVRSQGFASYNYWVVKLNSDGKIQWQKALGGRGADYLMSIQQTSDGGYILGGYSDSVMSTDKSENGEGLIDYWVVKLK
jgi:hypothetical protein